MLQGNRDTEHPWIKSDSLTLQERTRIHCCLLPNEHEVCFDLYLVVICVFAVVL